MVNFRDAKDEIRQRIDILDVLSEYVAVKRAGKSYKGLCPFHSEKTPSFTVSDEFQTWHCFGCGEHGDVFSFLMKIENLTFAEALERLAKRAGVELEHSQDHQVSRRELLGKLNAMAAAHYAGLLKQTPTALEYLRSRGLADQTIEQFQLGCAAPAWDDLVRHLTKKGADLQDAEQAGLVVKGERGIYDRFRHRIIFPILDIQERVIGFGARAMGDDQPKYLNSPETPLFSKTKSLYGLNVARKAIAEKGYAIVVEGYMDVIAVHQAGFSNCVATLGTALTVEHIGVLSRYTKKIVLAYDADSAGMTAALRGAAMFDEAESDVRIVRLPGGEDPDSILRKGKVADFEAAISGALPIIDYRLELLRERHDLSSPAGRAAMLKEAVRILVEVPSTIEREKFIRTLARFHPNFETGTAFAEEHIRTEVDRQIQRQSRHSGPVSRGPDAGPPRGVLEAERQVLRVLISAGEGADLIIQGIAPEDFVSETGRAAAGIIYEMLAQSRGICLPNILEAADKDVGKYISELATRDDWPPMNEKALQDYMATIRNSRLRNMRTSDVLAPYMKQGMIDTDGGPHEHTIEDLEAFLKRSGKLPRTGGQ